MKAVVKVAPAPGLEMCSVPDPVPQADEIILQVRSTSMCGTDSHIYRWDAWAQQRIRPPRILGHEMFGEVSTKLGQPIPIRSEGVLTDFAAKGFRVHA